MKRWGATVAFVVLPALTFSQSLGDLAKKERERRQKNQEQGVKARTVTDEEISTETDASAPPAPPVESSAKVPSSGSTPAGADKASSTSKPPLKEQEWRYRVAEARSRVQKARERYDSLNELPIVPGMKYVDENGNALITSLSQLRGMVGQAKAELDAAEKAQADLLEEARRAGVPPGWLR